MKNKMITMLAVAFFSAAMVLTPGCKKKHSATRCVQPLILGNCLAL